MKWKTNMLIELEGLKCDHQVSPWPWAQPWVFKVNYGICYISAKNGLIAMKQKQRYWLKSMPQMLPFGLTLDLALIGEVTGLTSDVGMLSTLLIMIW